MALNWRIFKNNLFIKFLRTRAFLVRVFLFSCNQAEITFMNKRILIQIPTIAEARLTCNSFGIHAEPGFKQINQNGLAIDLLISGAGMTPTAWALGKHLNHHSLAIQLGLAGTYRDHIKIGTLVRVKKDVVADFGVWQHNSFDPFTKKPFGFTDAPPFQNGNLLENFPDLPENLKLPEANAATVSSIIADGRAGTPLANYYQADIESMEGAAFFYATAKAQIPALQIRAISNKTAERDPQKWNIPLALQNLNSYLLRLLAFLAENGNFRTFETKNKNECAQ